MKTFLKILFFFLLFTHLCFPQGFWTKIGDMPEIRLAHTADEINGKIYIVGGGDYEGGTDARTALVYDRSSGIWTIIPLINNEIREFHTSCVVDGKLFVIGGWILVNNQWVASTKIDMFDPNTGTWTSKNPMPTGRGNLGCAAIDGKIYVIGGTAQEDLGLKTLEAYDISAGTWTKLSDMPTGRWGISVQAFNGKIYVFGGRSINDYAVYASVEVYDPQTGSWTTKSKMPTPRYGFTTCLLDSNIYTIGGWLESSPPGPIYNEVEIYNPEKDEWHSGRPMPVARALQASIVHNGKIYVYGGSRTNHPLIGTSAIYELTFDDIFAQQPYLDKLYARENLDSVLIRTRFSNIYGHQFTPHLIIANMDSIQIDSLTLYDDSLHEDSLSNDGLYAAYVSPRQTEEFFTLSISTMDNQNNKYYFTPDRCRFTTVGPVTLDSVVVKPQFGVYSAKPYLHNNGSTASIVNGTVKLVCNDPWIFGKASGLFSLPTLPPGASAGSGLIVFQIIDSLFHGYCNFRAEVIIDGWTYWKDSIKVFFPITGVDDEIAVPLEFKLEQNFPNPFNPTTTIKYGIKERSNVKITIYNIIGEEAAIVLNEEMHPGFHQVDFNAANLPSGVYFYRLQAGSFVDTKKMVVLK